MHRLSLGAASEGYSLVSVLEHLILVASLVGSTGSRRLGFGSCGSQLSCSVA